MSPILQSVSRRLRQRRPAVFARCRRLHDDRGSALVELGLMLSFLGVPLLLATVYFATLLLDDIEIANAAHAGAMYGMESSTFAEDTANIIAAARAETSRFGSNLAVTPSIFYACSTAISGTQYSTQSAANTACTGGSSHALEFIQVTASASIAPPGSFPGWSNPVTLSSTSVMEVEE